MQVADIIINRPSKQIDRTFSYRIPAHLDNVAPGKQVVVPFAGSLAAGIVLAVREDEGSADFAWKDIYAVPAELPQLSAELLELADFVADYYLCTKIEALRLCLPEKSVRLQVAYRLTEAGRAKYGADAPAEGSARVWQELAVEPDAAVAAGELLPEVSVPGALRLPTRRIWEAVPGAATAGMAKKRRQHELYEYLSAGARDDAALREAGFSAAVCRAAAENGYIRATEVPAWPTAVAFTPQPGPELTAAQETALAAVTAAMREKRPELFLLHGVTGSGKTEVYLRAAEEALAAGGAALILVPEIALTEQMIRRVRERFGEELFVSYHSGLTPRERFIARERVARGQARIVIGARSAVFLPFPKLALLVVDEEYDSSYKQEETTRYDARKLVEWRARYHGCPVVYGAASPAVTTYYRALRGELSLLRLLERIGGVALPAVEIVDMRSELETGNRSIVSRSLHELTQATLAAGKQLIFLLNRRGFSTYILCRSCGHVLTCPNCERPYTYHLATKTLRCHHCEQSIRPPAVCPNCGSQAIRYFGMGTERAEQMLREMFPGIRIARLDSDSISRRGELERILSEFRAGRQDLLLGTQLVAKGHDLPHVATVGILSIDNILHLPQYTASERAFQLVMQAAGRAGRRTERGRVILQTYQPTHYALQAAAKHDYDAFYQEEISIREFFGYPPFRERMRVTVFDPSPQTVRRRMYELYETILDFVREIPGYDGEITAPYEEYYKRIRDNYYYSMQIGATDLTPLKQRMRRHKAWRKNGIIIDIDIL
ncbi:MAG: primosomal protein N' [Veillonellaceae bacterium]|nr:primosomal protein N' [Veillonellaceae bacterium]